MKKKDLVHAPKSCGGTFEILYDNEIPYLKCDKCGHEIKDWIKWESCYKNLWQEEANWAEDKNHLTVLLGYFCARYEDYYEISYSLSLNEKGLFRGPEINILRRVYSMLGKDPWLVKDYIDFIFEVKIKQRKKRVTSLSFLAVTNCINEFKHLVKKSKQISRSTKLPAKMIDWVNLKAPEVNNLMELNDFGDLNLLLTYYKQGHFQEEALHLFVSKLKKMNYIRDDLRIIGWRSDD